jgi:type I restriction enzyme, S subunit
MTVENFQCEAPPETICCDSFGRDYAGLTTNYEWREATLGEICDEVGGIIQTGPFGSQLHESDYSTDGVPVVMPKDIIEGRIVTQSVARISPEHVKRLSRHKLELGDIVYGRRGDIGRQALIRLEQKGWLCGTGCLRLSLGDSVIDSLFFHYYLRQESVIRWISNQAVGATMPNLNTGILRSVPVSFPSLPDQRRIAGILSAYDDLIENCQRRIRILGEMARSLYREWFVYFRFPCHENHPLVPSSLGDIPEGWEVKPLKSLMVDHIGGGWGKDIADEDHTEPAWVIRGTDIPNARSSRIAGVPHRFHTESNLRTRRLQAGDILFEVSGGSKGQPVGRTLLVTPELLSAFGDKSVICASFCKRIRPDAACYGSELMYLSFLEGYESGEIEQFQVQSTGISNFKWTEYIAKIERVIPPESLRFRFRELVVPLFSQIATIGLQIQNLRRTRDLLLPRLLSGQLELTLINDMERIKYE